MAEPASASTSSGPTCWWPRVLRCPVFGGKVASYDASRANAIAGVHDVVPVSAGLAVVADNYWAASRGLQALADDVTWDEGPLAGLTTDEISRPVPGEGGAARGARAQRR